MCPFICRRVHLFAHMSIYSRRILAHSRGGIHLRIRISGGRASGITISNRNCSQTSPFIRRYVPLFVDASIDCTYVLLFAWDLSMLSQKDWFVDRNFEDRASVISVSNRNYIRNMYFGPVHLFFRLVDLFCRSIHRFTTQSNDFNSCGSTTRCSGTNGSKVRVWTGGIWE